MLKIIICLWENWYTESWGPDADWVIGEVSIRIQIFIYTYTINDVPTNALFVRAVTQETC